MKSETDWVAFPDVDAAVKASVHAQELFQALKLEQRRTIVAALRSAAIQHSVRWGHEAVAETGMGRADDKATKNLLCARRTPGVEDLPSQATIGDQGLTLVEYAPFGVVASVTPSTNPVATIISNAIGLLAAGNSVVFATHPSAAVVGLDALRVLAAAVIEAGAPPGLITTISPSSNESTLALLADPRVSLNLVTGGPAIVKVAMTTGKVCKIIAAGPGNPPVVVDETAAFPQCTDDIITGASFDNNLLCVAEKEVIVVEAARPRFLAALRSDPRAHELTEESMDALAGLAFLPGHEAGVPVLNRLLVGRDASVLASSLGLKVAAEVRLLWGVVANDHPFVKHEQLMPVLPVTFVDTVAEAIILANEVEGGNHHSAAMHSHDITNLTRMGRAMKCSLFVNNAPTLYGLGSGDGYASMSIGTPTGDGITKASHFVRPLQFCLVGSFRIT